MRGQRETIPSGVVAFLFTDVEGSTRLWAADADAMAASLRVHDEILRSSIDAHAGYVFTTAGDAFCAAFDRASDAVAAAEAAQGELATANWPGPALKVRMGLHLGEADERGGDYFGPAVNTAARVEAAGHGAQVLVTDAVRSALALDAVDLGVHTLKDVPEPVHLWQVGEGEFPPLRTSAVSSNVPVPATRLVGRADDVRSVRLMLAEHRLVTLVAVGGTGKTRLAIEVADEELPHWRDGVWFVDLTSASSDDDVALAVARAIGLELRSEERHDAIAGYLAGRELLVVLDNCEHVIDACAELAEAILAAGGRSAVLATSREWLDIDGERVFKVPSLAADGADSPAVRLFVDRAVAVDPDFVLDDDNVSDVAEVCRRLDGVPLAIELAASRVAVLAPAKLVAGLDDRFRLLSGGRRRQRHRTLEATIDWSYDLLEPDEQQVFRTLGVFAGSFDIEAVASIRDMSLGDATDVVEALYARSLLASAPEGHNRFHLLETLKAYAEDRLVDAGEAEDARERHCRHYVKRGGADTLWEARQLERNGRLLSDHPNLVLAADWLESAGRWDELAQHLFGIATVDGGAATTMLPRVRRAREHVTDRQLLDRLGHSEVFCTMALADWDAYAAAAGLLRESPDPLTTGYGYLYLALVTGGHAPEVASSFIDRFEAAGDEPTAEIAAEVDLWRALTAALHGDLATADTLATKASLTPIAQTLMGSNGMLVMAVARWAETGSPDELTAFADEMAGMYQPSGRVDLLWAATIDFARALAGLASGDLDAARAAVRRQALDATSGRVASLESDALGLLAELARIEGDADLARELILSTGPGRSPATMAATREIAKKLGVHEEIQASYCANALDPAWMFERPKQALQRELDRRGWGEARTQEGRERR